jgi:hypothetical protein
MRHPLQASNSITNSKRPYPEWLRKHQVFAEMKKIEKIFPRIGLPNFKEPCDIMNTSEALNDATRLGIRFITMLQTTQNTLQAKLNAALVSKDKDRNEVCAKLQSASNLINTLTQYLRLNDYAKVVEGRVVMRLREDVFNGDKNPVFKKNEALLRVINKIKDMCAELKVEFGAVDQLDEFKAFSRSNVPNKKYIVAFSSDGDDGLWDMSTISMRGITSCQAWNAPQSRGLIGSLSSKFVGVIYLASDQEIPGYGPKMLHRSMVRFAINKATKKPAIIMDRMYPSENQDTIAAFKKALGEKSKLEVHYTYNTNRPLNEEYYLPDEPSRKFLKQGEFSYMDYALPVQAHTPQIRTVAADITALTEDFKKKVAEDINAVVSNKRVLYEEAKVRQDALRKEYDDAKAAWEAENIKLIAAGVPEDKRPAFGLERPRMDADLAAFGKGGIINLMKHCDKKHGANRAGAIFAKMVLDSFAVPTDMDFGSKEEYHRKYLMGFLKDPKLVKEVSGKLVGVGTWMKSFPKSAERLHSFVLSTMKAYVVGGVRDIIKKPEKELVAIMPQV